MILADHATPVPADYDLPLSRLELVDERDQTNSALEMLMWSLERTSDPIARERLTDQMAEAYARLDAVTQLIEAL